MSAVPLQEAMAGTPELWPMLVSLRSRFTFRYSTDGRWAAAVTTDGRATVFCERWRLHGDEPRCERLAGFQLRARAEDAAEWLPVDAIPFADGSVLIVGRRRLTLLDPYGDLVRTEPVPFVPGLIAPAPDASARVLLLGRAGAGPDAPGLAWMWSAVAPAGPPVELPPVLLRGGGWLDPAGTRFAMNRHGGGTVVYDTDARRCGPLPLRTAAPDDLIWLTAPEAGTALALSTRGGMPELHLLAPDADPRRLHGVDGLAGKVAPMALHPAGRSLALHQADGMRDALWELDVETDTRSELPTPEGQAAGALAWMRSPDGPDRLWTLTVSTGLPGRVVDLSAGRDADGRGTVTDGSPAGDHDGWAPSRLARFPGADGEVEAIVCGHRDWRTAEHVVIALHGGPASRWSLKFSPFFQLIAAAGGTVVAVNPRGSTGYGDDFHRQIVGAWGGPDLHDVLAVARWVRSERGGDPPALYGTSYGAYLALLAAAADPGLWDRVLAVAPMLSGESLYAEATPSVRAMIDRLGGRAPVTDDLGPRDVAARVDRITAPLLIVHGDRDDLIPVGQSRHLAGLLAAAGRPFRYLEVPGGGHTPLDGSPELHRTAVRFLTSTDERR